MTHPPVVAGIDFGGSKIAVAVCDLTGNRLASARVTTRDASTTGPGGARAIFGRGVRTTRELLATAAPGRELAAVGVATFGIPAEDQVLLAPAIDGWESLALGRELRAAFPAAEVKMATDVKAAAAAEYRWGALRGCDPGVPEPGHRAGRRRGGRRPGAQRRGGRGRRDRLQPAGHRPTSASAWASGSRWRTR